MGCPCKKTIQPSAPVRENKQAPTPIKRLGSSVRRLRREIK